MNSIVICATRYGDAARVAAAVAARLRCEGVVEVLAANEAPAALPRSVELVIVGCPTVGRRMTEPMTLFFDRLRGRTLEGTAAAAFDTRLHRPRWLSGSAAEGIADRLRRAGARLVAPEESFFVDGRATRSGAPALKPGELERAAAWAASLAARVGGAAAGARAGRH